MVLEETIIFLNMYPYYLVPRHPPILSAPVHFDLEVKVPIRVFTLKKVTQL